MWKRFFCFSCLMRSDRNSGRSNICQCTLEVLPCKHVRNSALRFQWVWQTCWNCSTIIGDVLLGHTEDLFYFVKKHVLVQHVRRSSFCSQITPSYLLTLRFQWVWQPYWNCSTITGEVLQGHTQKIYFVKKINKNKAQHLHNPPAPDEPGPVPKTAWWTEAGSTGQPTDAVAAPLCWCWRTLHGSCWTAGTGLRMEQSRPSFLNELRMEQSMPSFLNELRMEQSRPSF